MSNNAPDDRIVRCASSFVSVLANDLLSRSVTANLVQYEMAKKWDGKMPQVSSGAIPLLQLGKP